MARYLAYTSPARGHLYPIVATLRELQHRGHEVAVRTLAAEVPLMKQLGFAAAPIASEIEAIEQDDWRARTPMGANKRVMKTFARRAKHEIPDVERATAEVEPDALLVDINCQGAATVAEASERPWAMWTPYFTPLPSRDTPPFGLGIHPRRDRLGRTRDALFEKVVLGPPERQAARSVNGLRAQFGLPPFRRGTELWAAAPLHLYFTSEPFEYPRSDWPPSFRLLGPGIWEPPAEPPEWLDQIQRPLVLVTLSTEFQDDGKLAAIALEALANENIEVVVTTAAVDPASFAAPPNARVERFVPHGPLLQRAACVVCHGGMGITQRALAAGVPVCVVPFGRDQLEVAGHLTWCDAGTRLAPQRLRPHRLRAAVKAAIDKRAGAQRIAAAFESAGGAEAAADALEQLVTSTRSVPPSGGRPLAGDLKANAGQVSAMDACTRARWGRPLLAAALVGLAAVPAGCGSAANAGTSKRPSLHPLSSISDGAVLSKPVRWTARAAGVTNGDPVDRVEFSIDGRVRWTEQKAPYFFNDDYNRLYPWVLSPGPHRLAVRVITAAGKSASTSAHVTVSAQPQPDALTGTYARTVTPAEIRRTQPLRNEPPDQVLPAGTWRLRIAAHGVFYFDDPQGGGGSEAFTALADGTLTMQGPVNWLEPSDRQGSFCGVEPTGAYHWTTTAHTLVLAVHSDRCADRNSMFTGTWRRE